MKHPETRARIDAMLDDVLSAITDHVDTINSEHLEATGEAFPINRKDATWLIFEDVVRTALERADLPQIEGGAS